jgi:hypothetical protein
MKSLFVTPILLLAALLPFCVTARLGDTELQCETRYGKPISAPTATMTTTPFTRRYKFDGWIIEATFVNRRVAKQSYMKVIEAGYKGDVSSAFPAILQAEAGSGTWQSYVYVKSSGVGYQNGIVASASKWRNTNGRIAYTSLVYGLVVEEKGYSDTQTPKAAPAKLPNF